MIIKKMRITVRLEGETGDRTLTESEIIGFLRSSEVLMAHKDYVLYLADPMD